jgi:hypothetical protein
VHLEQGEASEPDDPAFELELADWRPYGGTAGGSPSRGLRTTAHQERYDARVDEQRDRLYARAGEATAGRLERLGWERVALLAERGVASAFRAALPAAIADRLVVDAEANVDRDDPATIADTVEPWLEDAWRKSVVDLADRARRHALAGGPGAIGAKETLWALDEGRVEHLILDPDADFTAVAAMTPPGIAGPPELLGERAVEAAVATGAQVSTVPAATAPALEESGGMVALLRY